MARYVNSVPQILDGNGKPIVGAKKFFFNQGTTTKKTIYSDSSLTITAANPVLSDSDGRFPDTFLDGLYKEEQQDNSGTATGYDGVTLWTRDPVGEIASGPFELWDSSIAYEIPDIVKGSDDNYYRSLVDANTGSDPVLALGNWEELNFGRIWESGATYAIGDAVYGSDGYLYVSKTSSNTGNNPTTSLANWAPKSPLRGCLAYSTTGLSFSATPTILAFDEESYDTNDIHDKVTNNSRLTVPAGVTKIKLSWFLGIQSRNTTTHVDFALLKNGASFMSKSEIATISAGGDHNGMTAAITVAAADYFEVRLTSQAGTQQLWAGDRTYFAMEIIE